MTPERFERELHPTHRTGIHGIQRMAGQPMGQPVGLLGAAFAEFHVDAPTEDPVIARFDFAVAEEKQPGLHALIACCWSASRSRMPRRPSLSSSAK